jgi:hypothetical protein
MLCCWPVILVQKESVRKGLTHLRQVSFLLLFK